MVQALLVIYSANLVFLWHSSRTHLDSNLKLKLLFWTQDTLPNLWNHSVPHLPALPLLHIIRNLQISGQPSHTVQLTLDSRHPSLIAYSLHLQVRKVVKHTNHLQSSSPLPFPKFSCPLSSVWLLNCYVPVYINSPLSIHVKLAT